MAFHPIGLLFSQPPTHGGCCSFSRPTYLATITIRLLVLKARASCLLRTKSRPLFLRLSAQGWLYQGENNEGFAGHRADIVVQANDPDAGDFLDQCLKM